MKNISVVVLAAGEGTRMKSALPKVLHKVNGLPMLLYLLRTTRQLGASDYLVVLGYKKEEVTAVLPPDVEWVEQKEQRGTGHALQVALQQKKRLQETILVLCGDIPLLTAATLEDLVAVHQNNGQAITILSAELDDPFSYGRIVRDANGRVIRIVEEKDASQSEREIKEINSGIYCFSKAALGECLDLITPNNRQNEYYLTDVIDICHRNGGKIAAVITPDAREIAGINTLKDLAWAGKEVNRQVLDQWLTRGVTIIDPDDTYIDCRVQIGRDTIIYPLTYLEGESVIGENCQIGPAARISDCLLGDRVAVQFSVLDSVKVKDDLTLPPFSHAWSKARKEASAVETAPNKIDLSVITPLKGGDQVMISSGGILEKSH